MNQSLTNSVHGVPQVCQFILVLPKNFKAYTFMYAFFPIAYHSLSTECSWFPCFLRNVLNLETENPLHYLASNYVLHVFHLEVDVGLCEHIRYSSL